MKKLLIFLFALSMQNLFSSINFVNKVNSKKGLSLIVCYKNMTYGLLELKYNEQIGFEVSENSESGYRVTYQNCDVDSVLLRRQIKNLSTEIDLNRDFFIAQHMALKNKITLSDRAERILEDKTFDIVVNDKNKLQILGGLLVDVDMPSDQERGTCIVC